MSVALPTTLTLRQAVPADFPEVRRITREAYLRARHFTADHPYMRVLEDVERGAEQAEVWAAETDEKVVAAVTLTFASQPYSDIAQAGELEFRMLAVDPSHQGGGVDRAVACEIIEHARQLPGIEAISITSATFMERAHNLYWSLGFRRARTWTGTCRVRTSCSGCSGLSYQAPTLPFAPPKRPPNLTPLDGSGACSWAPAPSPPRTASAEADHTQTRLKELMARRGNTVYLLADSSKLSLKTVRGTEARTRAS